MDNLNDSRCRLQRCFLWVVRASTLALLMFLSACSMSPQHAGSHSSANASVTPTAAPHPPLQWRQVSPPNGVNFASASLAMSPVDGHDAWICAQGPHSGFQIWRTQDGGLTWQPASTLTPGAPLPITSCALVANQTSASGLAAVFMWGAGIDGTLRSRSYYSTDGGAQWTQLAGDQALSSVASSGAVTYALLMDTSAAAANQTIALVASRDQLVSWHAVQPVGLALHDSVEVFWAAPVGGQLLAQTANNELFSSTTGGASWSPVQGPSEQVIQLSLAATSGSDGQWYICGTVSATHLLECSSDLGQSWSQLPLLFGTYHCDACGKGGVSVSGTTSCPPSSMTQAEVIVVSCGSQIADSNGLPQQSAFVLYGLPRGAIDWMAIGAAPSLNIQATQTGQILVYDELRHPDVRAGSSALSGGMSDGWRLPPDRRNSLPPSWALNQAVTWRLFT